MIVRKIIREVNRQMRKKRTDELECRVQLVIQSLLQVIITHELQVLILGDRAIVALLHRSRVGFATVQNVSDSQSVQQFVILRVMQSSNINILPDLRRFPVQERHFIIIDIIGEHEPTHKWQSLCAMFGIFLPKTIEPT